MSDEKTEVVPPSAAPVAAPSAAPVPVPPAEGALEKVAEKVAEEKGDKKDPTALEPEQEKKESDVGLSDIEKKIKMMKDFMKVGAELSDKVLGKYGKTAMEQKINSAAAAAKVGVQMQAEKALGFIADGGIGKNLSKSAEGASAGVQNIGRNIAEMAKKLTGSGQEAPLAEDKKGAEPEGIEMTSIAKSITKAAEALPSTKEAALGVASKVEEVETKSVPTLGGSAD